MKIKPVKAGKKVGKFGLRLASIYTGKDLSEIFSLSKENGSVSSVAVAVSIVDGWLAIISYDPMELVDTSILTSLATSIIEGRPSVTQIQIMSQPNFSHSAAPSSENETQDVLPQQISISYSDIEEEDATE